MTGETEVVEDCGHPILDTIGNMAVRLMEVTRERDTALAEAERLQMELAESRKMHAGLQRVIAERAQENGDLKARARALVNAMHEFPERDWTEVLAFLEKALLPAAVPSAAPGVEEG